jgi:KDO2-lipid IV(A) lauroyltransferase
VPAELALKYDIPLVPAYAMRRHDGSIEIEFEAPIPHSKSIEMMEESLKGLEKHIQAHPEQWYWYHNRW